MGSKKPDFYSRVEVENKSRRPTAFYLLGVRREELREGSGFPLPGRRWCRPRFGLRLPARGGGDMSYYVLALACLFTISIVKMS